MFKKLFIFPVILLFFNLSGMSKLTKTSSKDIYTVYKNETLKIDRKLKLLDTIINIPANKILEIKALKGCARLILNENSKIILGKNSQLILKGIIFEGVSVQDNFEFDENSKVIHNSLTIFITEIPDNSNPPFEKRAFFQSDDDRKNFEIKRDFLY